jgi:hypothetical protein
MQPKSATSLFFVFTKSYQDVGQRELFLEYEFDTYKSPIALDLSWQLFPGFIDFCEF